MTTHNILRNEAMLSFVSDQPYAFHHLPSDTHIVFWMGLGLTRAQALLMISNWKEMAYVKQTSIRAAYEEFQLAYIANAFGDVSWRYRLEQGPLAHYNWLSGKLWSKLQDFDPQHHFVKRTTIAGCLRALQQEEVLNT